MYYRKFNGQGKSDDLRIAVLWSKVPNMVILPAILFTALVKYSEFYRFQSLVQGSFILKALAVICFIIEVVISIWCFFNLLSMISEVQQFSKWTAFITYIIPGLVIFVFSLGMILLVGIAGLL